MSIPVVVYVRPHGEQRETEIDRPAEIEALASRFIEAGGRYTVEELGGMGTSYCAEFEVDGETQDIACEIGFDSTPPLVKHYAAFDKMVADSVAFLAETSGEPPK